MTSPWRDEQTKQMVAVLGGHEVGREWAQSLVPVGQTLDDLTFADVFNVNPDDVVRYAREFGWNPRVVVEVDSRPPDAEAYAKYYLFLRGNAWVRASPGDRGEWIEDEFESLEKARRDMARILLHIQWGYWNDRNRNRRGRSGGSLFTLYPPPPA